METHLRLILFLVGSVILALVVWDIIRQRTLRKQQVNLISPEDQYDPEREYESRQRSLDFGSGSEDPWIHTAEFELEKKEPVQALPAKQTVVATASHKKSYSLNDMFALFVMARDPKGFNGRKLQLALETAHLSYGAMNIFNRHDNNNSDEILFSVASAVEPGFFNLKTLDMQFIPGITIFMVFSNVSEPLKAFDSLVRTAKQLAFSLNGELRDKYHKPLTLQLIDSYKNDLGTYANSK